MPHFFIRAFIFFLISYCFIITGCAPSVHVERDPDFVVDGLALKDAVRLSYQSESPGDNKNSRCGYELTPSIWILNFNGAKKEQETVECHIPENRYILIKLINKVHVIMSGYDAKLCESTSKLVAKEIGSLHDISLQIDDFLISDLAPFRHEVQGCPDPFYKNGHFLAGLRSHAAGYFVLLAPFSASSIHHFSFSAINPCWDDLYDPATNGCISSNQRRTVNMTLTISKSLQN